MQTPYTVPEIARLTGIPETTLYDYVKQFVGIVPEMDATDEGGRQRRRYPEQAIAVFQTIRHLKDRGVDLPTIRALLEEGRTQEDEGQEATSVEYAAFSENGGTPQTEIVPALETLSQEAVETTLEATETSETGQVVELTDPLIVAPVYGEGIPAVDVTVAIVETAADADSAVQETSAVIESPFFEAPAAIDEAAAPVESPAGWLESGPVVEASLLESAPVAFATEVVEEPVQQAITESAGPDLLVLRGQLFSSLDEGLRSLHELMDSQHDDGQRLQAELAKQKEENERLRAALAYQQDQARSAERLLAFIKDHCEQGIQAITV